MKAPNLLAANIAALLRSRHQKQTDLAQWCRHSDVWLSFALDGKRGFRISDLDRIADFFGLQAYQLLQPGISAQSERRVSDRRTTKDRRLAQNFRIAQELGVTLTAPQRSGLSHGVEVPPTPSYVHEIMADAERKIEARRAAERRAGEQTPVARRKRARKTAGG